MWFKTIFRHRQWPSWFTRWPLVTSAYIPEPDTEPLFDEAFLRRMERLSLQAQRTLRGNPASGEHPSRHAIPASIFSDHRPYSHGDDVRYVDWNAYARHNHILLRLGEAEQDVNVHLLIDASRSMTFGKPSRLRLAQQLAGAIGYLALAHSDRLHIVAFGAANLPTFGPAQGKGRFIEMLQFIADIAPQPTTNLCTTIRQHAQYHPRGGLIIICSDLFDPTGLAQGLEALPSPRWQVLVLHLLDQHDLQPELQGPLELIDSETGESMVVTLDREARDAYQQRIAAWRERLARECVRYGANYTPIMSHWSLEQQVVPYLRSRRLLH